MCITESTNYSSEIGMNLLVYWQILKITRFQKSKLGKSQKFGAYEK